jgi:hypothetical protein
MKTLTQEEKPGGKSDEGMEENDSTRQESSPKKADSARRPQRKPGKAKGRSSSKKQ